MGGLGGRDGREHARWVQATLSLVCGAVLAGCSAPEVDPVGWWHDLQGGAIAEQRPPPPGATDPYPNLASVRPRPVMIDADTKATISARLAGERDATARRAASDPLVAPFAAPTAYQAVPAPAGQSVASASMPAATAPPGGASAARAGASQPATLPAPPLGAITQPHDPPALAAAPPAPPSFVGAGAGAAQVAPSGEAAVPVISPDRLTVYFLSGQDRPSTNAPVGLRSLARRRKGGVIEVIGHGEAAAQDPASQQAALSLALKRAQTVADALEADGVPASALHVRAVPFGRDATATLLD